MKVALEGIDPPEERFPCHDAVQFRAPLQGVTSKTSTPGKPRLSSQCSIGLRRVGAQLVALAPFASLDPLTKPFTAVRGGTSKYHPPASKSAANVKRLSRLPTCLDRNPGLARSS
jgi:hypothetical protein